MIAKVLVFLPLWLALAACGGTGGAGTGGGGPCGPCESGFKCGARGACVIDPVGLWVVTATTGWVAERKLDGTPWDAFGGLPDPYVCLTIGGQRRCTSPASDTLKPSWQAAFPAATATALQAGVTVEYWDRDIAADDAICTRATFGLGAKTLAAGSVNVGCGRARDSGFTLAFAAR